MTLRHIPDVTKGKPEEADIYGDIENKEICRGTGMEFEAITSARYPGNEWSTW